MDSNTKVGVQTGIDRRREASVAHRTGTSAAKSSSLKVQLGKISKAVKSIVPQAMWAAIVEELEELEQQSEALDVGTDSFDDDDEPYDPTEFIDEDEASSDLRSAAVTEGDWTTADVDGAFAVTWTLVVSPRP